MNNLTTDCQYRPEMRDLFIRKPDTWASDDWIGRMATTIHVLGAHAPEQIYSYDRHGDFVCLQQAFEDYIDNVDHWGLGTSIERLMPDLTGLINFRASRSSSMEPEIPGIPAVA